MALSLNRKPDQAIIVDNPDGSQTVITVLKVRGDEVRIAVDAPQEYPVNRSEVRERIQQEGRRRWSKPR